MNAFKRAITNVVRQPLKSSSLLLLVTILGGILLGGVSMSRALSATEERLLMQVPAVATLVYDGTQNSGWDQPTKEEINSIGSLPYVRAYDFTLRTHFHSQNLLWIDSMNPGYFTGRGVNNPIITDIESGLISLVEGRVFTQEEIDQDAMVMVIPQSFALVNNLGIGSSIEIANIANDYRWIGDWSDRFNDEFVLAKQMLEFEIIGIFTSEIDYGEGAQFIEPIIFYMPFGVAEDMLNFEIQAMVEEDEEAFRSLGQGIFQEEHILETLFVLYSPRDLEDFSTASLELLPDEWVVMGIDESVFAPIVNSMNIMLDLANAIQFTVVVVSILILTLILILFLRDRRHEMGVYRALGESKMNIIFQIMMEVGTVAVIGMFLSIFIGHILSTFVSSFLFEQHLIEQLASNPFGSGIIPWELTIHIPRQMSVEEAMALFDVTLSLSMIFAFISIGIIVVLISTIIPIWYAVKLEPKDLLL